MILVYGAVIFCEFVVFSRVGTDHVLLLVVDRVDTMCLPCILKTTLCRSGVTGILVYGAVLFLLSCESFTKSGKDHDLDLDCLNL